MGTRSQVHMNNSGVYIYQHYDGYNLPNEVRNALSKKERWDEEEYLTRIIFSEMIKDNLLETTGFGIGTVLHYDIEYLVSIDVEKQRITIIRGYSENDDSRLFEGTFQEFVDNERTEW